jgi:PPK2 family polyphosphate:nucleotide phosphotransferase
MTQLLSVPPGTHIRLKDYDPRFTDEKYDKESAKKKLEQNAEELAELGYRLYAENQRSLLLILQGLDASGKDGTIREVMRGFNPQACEVVSFKRPSELELDHDFLWRIHQRVPNRGNIGIFNRSHYEDVLVVRVHGLVPEKEWKSRFELINSFEKLLVEGDTTIVKCFLHISKDEQRQRLQARLDDPKKRWKFNPGDIDERKRWDEYQQAYEDVLNKCNTDYAPWYIVPADRNWYRNLVVSEILVGTLRHLNPQFPAAAENLPKTVV